MPPVAKLARSAVVGGLIRVDCERDLAKDMVVSLVVSKKIFVSYY